MTDSLTEKLERNAEKSRQLSLGKALDEPLEHWPSSVRAAPNALIRCALFRASRGAKERRHMHQGTLIASLGGLRITYKGEDLDQKDLDVWMGVLQLYRKQKVDKVMKISSIKLLELAGLTNTGPNHHALKERLKRLQFTQINIEPEDPASTSKFFFAGSLIQEAERNTEGTCWEISLSPKVRGLFSGGYTWVDWQIRDRLRRSPLAQWLYSFYRSHDQPYDMKISTLYELCGSGTADMRYFRSDLKKAMARVSEACLRYDKVFDWQHDKTSDKIRVRWQTVAQIKS